MKKHTEIIILMHREINLRTVVHLNAPYYLLQEAIFRWSI